MSSFGFLNVSGIDGVGSGSGSGGTFPGGIDKSVQFNDGGLAFGGVSTFLYDKVSATLSVNNAKPIQIIDGSNSVGTAGQVLSSTGSGLEFVTPVPVAPGAPVNSVQFNNAGAFGGDSNLIFNPTTDVLNVNGNVGIGSLSAPTDRLVVTGANSTIRVKSTTFNNANLVLEDSSVGVKQLQMSVNTDSADITSIQQGSGFRNFRFNPTDGSLSTSISIATTSAQAQGGFQCSNLLSNRKIILNQQSTNEHQNYSLGINSSTFRFQIPDVLSGTRFAWFGATGTGTSTELMRLSGNGTLSIGNTNSTFPLEVTGTIRSTSVRPNTILDTSNAAGTAGQVLSSTGTAIQWVNPVGPAGSNTQIQYNNGGVFGASVGFTFDPTTDALSVNQVNTNVIIPTNIQDISLSSGLSGQLLSSTGSAIQWVNPPVGTLPGGANTNIQFNSAGSFGGSNNFTYTDTTSHLKVQGLLTVGNLFTTVPRIFAQSGSALFAVSAWDNQWILAGGGSGAANSAGIGMGYNNSITSGIIACSEPSTGYKPIIYSAASHDFKTNGSTRMTVTQTGGGDGLLTVPILQATQIRDGLLNTGTDGQVLSSTGIGLLWKSPAPYCAILNGSSPAGGFSAGTGIPPIGTAANAIFGAFPRTSSYRISTSVSGYSGGAGTVNNMQIWYRTTSGNPWVLSHTHQLYFNNALFHLPYPTKSNIISITAGNPLQILVRALTPNTASDNNDFFNIEILECTI